MKTNFFNMAIMAFAVLPVVSCQTKKTDGKAVLQPAAVQETTNLSKEEIASIREKLPTLVDIGNLIKSSGAAYLPDQTMENLNVENLLTRTDRAKALGFITWDVVYAKMYDQVETVNKLLVVSEDLSGKLGFQDLKEYMKQFRSEYGKARNNEPARDSLIEAFRKRITDLVTVSGSAKDVALVFASTVVKSINVITRMILFTPNNDQLMVVLKNQKDALNAVFEVLGKSPADEDMNKFLKVLSPINKHFQSEKPFTPLDLDQINKITTVIIK
jgi:hypothetical protein